MKSTFSAINIFKQRFFVFSQPTLNVNMWNIWEKWKISLWNYNSSITQIISIRDHCNIRTLSQKKRLLAKGMYIAVISDVANMFRGYKNWLLWRYYLNARPIYMFQIWVIWNEESSTDILSIFMLLNLQGTELPLQLN